MKPLWCHSGEMIEKKTIFRGRKRLLLSTRYGLYYRVEFIFYVILYIKIVFVVTTEEIQIFIIWENK